MITSKVVCKHAQCQVLNVNMSHENTIHHLSTEIFDSVVNTYMVKPFKHIITFFGVTFFSPVMSSVRWDNKYRTGKMCETQGKSAVRRKHTTNVRGDNAAKAGARKSREILVTPRGPPPSDALRPNFMDPANIISYREAIGSGMSNRGIWQKAMLEYLSTKLSREASDRRNKHFMFHDILLQHFAFLREICQFIRKPEIALRCRLACILADCLAPNPKIAINGNIIFQ
jgi:hypothetical protein